MTVEKLGEQVRSFIAAGRRRPEARKSLYFI